MVAELGRLRLAAQQLVAAAEVAQLQQQAIQSSSAAQLNKELTRLANYKSALRYPVDFSKRSVAASVIQDLNIAMKWLSYPGRTNGTATAEEVEFSNPGGAR